MSSKRTPSSIPREPAAAIAAAVYDALVAAGVPDREAREAAEAVASGGGTVQGRAPAVAPAPDGAGTVEIWRTLSDVEAASTARLDRAGVAGSALTAFLAAAAVISFGAFPEARLLLDARPVHPGAALPVLAVILNARQALSDRAERRRLALAREDLDRFAARFGTRLSSLFGSRNARDSDISRRASTAQTLLRLSEAALLLLLAVALALA